VAGPHPARLSKADSVTAGEALPVAAVPQLRRFRELAPLRRDLGDAGAEALTEPDDRTGLRSLAPEGWRSATRRGRRGSAAR